MLRVRGDIRKFLLDIGKGHLSDHVKVVSNQAKQRKNWLITIDILLAICSFRRRSTALN